MKRAPVIAVASGKGGTGKTTFAVNMALAAGEPVNLLDCDAEEPNAHLFLSLEWEEEREVTLKKPVFDAALCDGCGRCAEVCRFNAIALPGGKPMFFKELCHACGGCAIACPRGAITEEDAVVGRVRRGRTGEVRFADGRINVGEPQAPPVIEEVLAAADPALPTIVDAPPGTSCPAVASLTGADYALLVTEPTPFGLHDLAEAVEMARMIGVPFSVALNRSDLGDEGVERYCEREGIEITARFPFDRALAEAYSRGKPAVEAVPAHRAFFSSLWRKLKEAAR